jgi:hypothetical protein
LSDKAKTAINSVYFNNKSFNYSIGRQGANVFPLGFGITNNDHIDAVFNNLVNNILNDNKIHFDTGIFGTPLLLDVLTKLGRSDLAYTLMNQRDYPGFGFMVEKGATTIWETWQGDASHSHPMFGSVCAWFYQYLGGISPDPANPGFKHAIVKPYPVSSLSYASMTYPSMYGEIRTRWEFVGNDYNLTVTIPANTSATVYLLAKENGLVTESGTSIKSNKDIKYIKTEGSNVLYKIGSGTYHFVSKGVKSLLKPPVLSSPIIYPGDTLVQQNDTVKVKITSDVLEAKIRYTIDGSEPDTTSAIYDQPFHVTKPTLIKAKAFLDGSDPSCTKINSVNFINQNVNGLTYQYFEGVWKKIPDFRRIPVIRSGIVYQIGLDKIIPGKDEFGLLFSGTIQIEKDGFYEFFLQSNDGSSLIIDNKLIIDNDGLHGADAEKKGHVNLTMGRHPIRINYFQAGGGMFLRLQYAGPNIGKQEVPATVLFQKI